MPAMTTCSCCGTWRWRPTRGSWSRCWGQTGPASPRCWLRWPARCCPTGVRCGWPEQILPGCRDNKSLENWRWFPRESDVAFGFSVREVVMMGRAPHQAGLMWPSAEDHARVEKALEQCDLAFLVDRSVNTLSGGERRRVTIARALVQEPQVLLLDEPAAHLDLAHTVQLYELVRQQVTEQQVACVAVMHDLAAVARWADRVVVLEQGSVRAAGPCSEVLEPALLQDALGIELVRGQDPETGLHYFLPRTGGDRSFSK